MLNKKCHAKHGIMQKMNPRIGEGGGCIIMGKHAKKSRENVPKKMQNSFEIKFILLYLAWKQQHFLCETCAVCTLYYQQPAVVIVAKNGAK